MGLEKPQAMIWRQEAQNNQIQSIYNEALHYGHARPLLTEYEKRFFSENQNPLNTVTDTELIQLAYDSKTAVRQEYSFDPYTPDENWKSGDTVELARFTIGAGYLGIMRRIDTIVIDSTTGENISSWDNPQSWDNVFRFVVAYNHANEVAESQRQVTIPAAALPANEWNNWINAVPLFPLNSWNDDRYAWGNPSNEMGVMLPKRIVVRLFVVCVEDTGFKHTVKGRMVMTEQLEKSISAAWKARRSDFG